MLNFEKLLEEIGEFGNYQKYAIILLQARFEYFTSSAVRSGLRTIVHFVSSGLPTMVYFWQTRQNTPYKLYFRAFAISSKVDDFKS